MRSRSAAESGGGASAFDVADSKNVEITRLQMGKLRSEEMLGLAPSLYVVMTADSRLEFSFPG